MTRILFLAAAATLAGCAGDKTGTDTGTTDTGTTDTNTTPCPTFFEGATLVLLATVECTGTTTVEYYAETEGWTNNGLTFAQETGNTPPNYSDEHDIDSFEFDQCGNWDHLRRELTSDAALADAQVNVNTVFSCANHFDPANGVMSYAVGVYDFDNVYADCLAWGEDPAQMIAGTDARINEPTESLAGCTIGMSTM